MVQSRQTQHSRDKSPVDIHSIGETKVQKIEEVSLESEVDRTQHSKTDTKEYRKEESADQFDKTVHIIVDYSRLLHQIQQREQCMVQPREHYRIQYTEQ